MRLGEGKGGLDKSGASETTNLVASKLARRGLDPNQLLAGRHATQESLRKHLTDARKKLAEQKDEVGALENQLFYVQYLRK